MFLDKLSNEKKLNKLIKDNYWFVLSTNSQHQYLYMVDSNDFISWNQIYHNVPKIIKNNKIILINHLKNISYDINLVEAMRYKNYSNNIIDVNGLYFSKHHIPISEEVLMKYNPNYKQIWEQYQNFLNTRYVKQSLKIPEPILYDLSYEESVACDKLYLDCQKYKKSSEYKSYLLRNIVFYTIEQNSIAIDQERLNEIDEEIKPLKNKSRIYLHYKIDVAESGRSSCHYQNINFMALKKTSKINDVIVSSFDDGKLYNFDYDAFHPRIIFQFLGKTIPLNQSGHEYIAEKYFNLSNKNHEEIKKDIFRILYGGHIENNKFSSLIEYFGNRVDLYKTCLGRTVGNIEWRKRLNYFVQKFEVDLMTTVMWKIIKALKKYKSKIILYQYDSIIIDIPNNERFLINEIKDMMANINNMKFKVNVKSGQTFGEIR